MSQRRRGIWNQVNRSRASVQRQVGLLITLALDKLYRKVADKVRQTGSASQDLDFLISDAEIEGMYQDIYKLVGTPFANGVFDSLVAQKQKAFVEDYWQRFVNSWLETTGAVLVKGVAATTKRDIAAKLASYIKLGLDVDQMAVNLIADGHLFNLTRAQVITRTEVIRASNLAALTGAQASGLDVKKEWISFIDGRTRRDIFDHVSSDGQVVAQDEPFIVSSEQLNYPGDVMASPGNTINCRCTVGFIRV